MGKATEGDIKEKGFSKLDQETETNTEDTNGVSNTNKNRNTTTSDRRGKNSRRRQKKMVTLSASSVVHPVQRLFNACKHVFATAGTGFVPSPDKIEQLSALLDEIQPADVGLTSKMPFFSPQVTRRAPTITYLHIHECEKFSIGIFCLPPSGVLPLHNHPGMTVFSKLLLGTMHIKSYDWLVDPSQSPQHPNVRLAKVKVDADLTAPCKTSILYPADGGNMHCFTAVTACAVLDVLGPPYSDPEGRHCTYYSDYPFTTFSGTLTDDEKVSIPEEEKEKLDWLQERDKPEDLVVVGAVYTGPEIVEN
ncbi:Plant cysteine oxidase 2 [Hibiscus syriacus]|uniref:cysteine dioxygenase n=1 Tax=Hibiscus syriacus TaxID=106335 RepID=A0A6A2XS75_HIBSY|nr:plant cysteine oxidase 2-like isoform X2 [Hibiscus syriacus]KAE8678458.1 Plant cysteine oxidase 2 [Hibiscus syriacus]